LAVGDGLALGAGFYARDSEALTLGEGLAVDGVPSGALMRLPLSIQKASGF